MVKKFIGFFVSLRFHTTFRLHQKFTRLRWYKRWHDRKISHHVHRAALAVYSFSVLAILIANIAIPVGVSASNGSATQTTFNGTSDGTYTNTTSANTGGDVALKGNGGLSNAGGGNWTNRKPVTVANPGSALTDYQVLLDSEAGVASDWRLDEASTGNANDSMGPNILASSAAAPTVVNDRNGVFKAREFNGSSQYLYKDSGASGIGGGSQFTMEAWVKPDVIDAVSRGIMTLGNEGNSTMTSMNMYLNNGYIYSRYGNGASAYKDCNSSAAVITAGTWQHIVATYNAGTVKLYVNGEEKSCSTGGSLSGNVFAPTTYIRVGNVYRTSPGNTYYFDGSIDEARTYNKELSLPEVTTRYGNKDYEIFNKAKSDGTDIRLTSSDGTTEIPYWIESFSNTTSVRNYKIWAKVPTIAASPSTTTINMYYGNPSATSSSSGTNTFNFFDDFETYNIGALNGQGGWAGTASYQVNNNRAYTGTKSAYATTGGGIAADYDMFRSGLTPDKNFVTSWYVYHQGGISIELGTLAFFENSTQITRLVDDNNGQLYDNVGALGYTLATGKWYRFQVAIKDTNTHDIAVFDGATQVVNLTGRANAANMTNGVNKIGSYHDFRYNTSNLDTLTMREYSSLEPTVTLGAETGVYYTGTSATYLTSLIPDSINASHTGKVYDWTSLAVTKTDQYNTGGPANTTVKVSVTDSAGNLIPNGEVSAGANTTGANDTGYFSSGSGQSVINLNLTNVSTSYTSLKIKYQLMSTNVANTPLVNEYVLNYLYDTTGPTIPANIVLTSLSTTQISLAWDVSTDTESSASPNEATIRYDVDRAPDSSGAPGVWADAGGNCSGLIATNSCTDSGLSTNTKYFYRVRAKDNIGNYSGYEGGMDGNTKGLFFLNDSSGTSVTDATSTSACTTVGSPTWGATGKEGTALNLGSPNSSRYINCGTARNSYFNPGGTSTIEFWAKPTALPSSGNWQWLVAKPFTSHDSPYYQYSITAHPDGAVSAIQYNTAVGTYLGTNSDPGVLSVGNWTHIALTLNLTNGIQKLYINGVNVATDDTISGTYSNYNTNLNFGSNPNYPAYGFTGTLDVIKISDSVRTGTEISNSFNYLDQLKIYSTTTLAAKPVVTSSPQYTNNTAPNISGTTTANLATVQLMSGSTVLDTTTSDGSGNFTFTSPYANALTEGVNSIFVRAANAGGNADSDLFSVHLDTDAPEKPTSYEYAKVDTNTGSDIANNGWSVNNNGATIYFSWLGASDMPLPPIGTNSDVRRHWVYFGPNASALPRTDGQATANALPNATKTLSNPVTGTDYYLRVQTEDNAGNISPDGGVTTLFTYKFDNTAPTAPTSATVTPAGWATEADEPYNFSWTAGADAGSGVERYQTARDNGESFTDAVGMSNNNVLHYQTGVNYLMIRTVDRAGNQSAPLTWPYLFSGSVGSPTNVSVNYSQSQNQTVNWLSFSWQDPVLITPAGYYYTIQDGLGAPSPEEATYVARTGATTVLAFDSYATKYDTNQYLIVVAKDEFGNVGWSNYSNVPFRITTVAPGVPQNVTIADSSKRGATPIWALTVAWNSLASPTPDFEGYEVWRCEKYSDADSCNDPADFDELRGTVTTNIFSEAGLNNTAEYFYKIRSYDTVGNVSAFSSDVHRVPTGNYTEPPAYTSNPTAKAEAKALSATIAWSTDRPSTSKVLYSATGTPACPGTGPGSDDYVTDHSVELTGLTPGVTYKYKIQSLDEHKDYTGGDGAACSAEMSFTTLAAPGISDVQVSEIRLTSAIVTWKTTSSATSKVLYGTSTSYGNQYVDTSASQTTTHTVKISDLTDSTTYNFKIMGTDVDGNSLQSDNYVFSTLTFPRLSNLRVEQVKNTATSTVNVAFDTNVPTSTVVTFSGAGGREVAKYDLERTHTVQVSGLLDNTSYVVSVKGRDQYGNEALSLTSSYKTEFDTRPPNITSITSEVSTVGLGADTKGQVVISWETDEPSTSQIEYASGVSGDYYDQRTQEETALTTSHVVIITGLKPSSSYHFRVVSRDAASNVGLSGDNSILTEQATSSVFDLIVNSLQSTIGWLFSAFSRN